MQFVQNAKNKTIKKQNNQKDLVMRTVFNMPIIDTMCPDNMTENTCGLRKYVNRGQKTFHISINETYLVPNTDDLRSVFSTFVEMNRICAKCRERNKKKAR